MNKVTVIGAGFVGATAAQRILEKELADVVLLDVVEGLAQGKALDMMQSTSVEGFTTNIVGTTNYADTKKSDIVVITAGLARKPGMTRDDLQAKNAEIVGGIVSEVVRYSPESIIIVVTNPLDVMTYMTLKKSGFPASRVIGMAGVLDSARYAYFLSVETKVPANEIQAMVLGGHGDLMVPLPKYTLIKGKPVTEIIPAEKLNAINVRTQNGGVEIVNLLKTGSAYYAPSSSAVAMVEAILKDSGKVLPCCAYLSGEYGFQNVYCGVPVRLTRNGVDKVIELQLTPEEKEALKRSVAQVTEQVGKLKI
ncbi:MAG: malate dehydrogenase [Omnitrophica bacterium RIFCSPLOWO2_12_FULL_44_17]|uniref:Malate dehydrogenase n=1 Tax=Candidatus Danuiimicrobium aquiferis TaxID=1801832 RepID=A0A1G1KXY5_9BACT|nr:MAG: malate dehydrogenase [Omnitrophica bacterium RIFCSPHIGHO2_02_FULL_45_28]OGW89318.1 MAG: malate dehydrogenase [Omnitrophica bacterium RIFCSPHIGHO2_12_FULL_44_12]OGW97479.1 MAG: malate dehydrogenase [Omnitrophica bacterium RIFCSPLOWO2_12_FULL_44_17]OGX04936.1 MAG: malate dehydrogenase [Omnitrophica bacterium RIFCSPLOWO2_02_FULL_44_11]